jgi:hypothetical protein
MFASDEQNASRRTVSIALVRRRSTRHAVDLIYGLSMC